MARPGGPALALLAALGLAAPAAHAEPPSRPPSLNLRGFEAPIDPASGLSYETAGAPASLELSVASWSHYAWGAVSLRQGGAIVARPLEHQLSRDLVASVAFLGRVTLGVDLPYVLWQGGDAPGDALPGVALPSQAFGDLALVAKITLVPPTNGALGGFALALHERFTLPTGDEASFLGEGDVTSSTRLLAEYRTRWFGAHLSAGLKLRGSEETLGCAALAASACPTRFGHELPFGAALTLDPTSFGAPRRARVNLFVELRGHLPVHPIEPFGSAAASELELAGGARVGLGDLSLLGGVGAGLLGGAGNAAFRASLAIGWTPRSHDRDGDGVRDEVDLCDSLPEDRDGFQDDDGCPDLDDDQDGVPDALDRCPRVPEDPDGFEDDDGCPDLDDDRDGIPDAEDACPRVKGEPHADPKRRGCPDPARGPAGPARLHEGRLGGYAPPRAVLPGTEPRRRSGAGSRRGSARAPRPSLGRRFPPAGSRTREVPRSWSSARNRKR